MTLARNETRIERNETRLERNETRLARNEKRGGNLHLGGTVILYSVSLPGGNDTLSIQLIQSQDQFLHLEVVGHLYM